MNQDSNPQDPDNLWYDASYLAEAENYYRKKFKIKEQPFVDPVKPPEDVVRPDWYTIPSGLLTQAERVLVDAHKAETLRKSGIRLP